MTTKVSIRGLRLFGRHGVMDQERRVGNEFAFDVELVYPFVRAAETDCLDDTINYAEVAGIIAGVNAEASMLIENVAWRLREALLARWPRIEGGLVTVTKLHPPIPSAHLSGASATIEW